VTSAVGYGQQDTGYELTQASIVGELEKSSRWPPPWVRSKNGIRVNNWNPRRKMEGAKIPMFVYRRSVMRALVVKQRASDKILACDCRWARAILPIPSTSTSHSNFASIFNAASETYNHNTENDLASHPLLPRLRSCNSPEAILNVLREQIPAPSQPQNMDELTKWVTPTVNVLFAFSATLGAVVGMLPRENFGSNACCSGFPTWRGYG
jgi:hypothetical protein